ncbi:glycoside hydrolase family 105 protein [Mucilaginibacter sp. AW1-3]
MKLLLKHYACTLGLAVLCLSSIPVFAKTELTSSAVLQNKPSKDSIKLLLRRTADWQIANFEKKPLRWAVNEWVYSTYYVGLYKTGKILNEPKYLEQCVYYSKKANWTVGKDNRRFFADDYLIGDLYCDLYQDNHDPGMISDFRQMADELIARKTNEPLEFKNMNVFRVWSWCDALFMGPASLMKLANVTHQKKYSTLMDSLWWKTYDYLYDKDMHLYYRDSRFFAQREKNGAKMFWGRGNGWVLAGLARVLEQMPKNYPTRKRYETLFKDMAAKIVTLQQADGMWRASLLDPESYPSKETSGTGLYCYGLTWGINNGLLPKVYYKPKVLAAWNALTGCVHPDGKLGFVQKIAEQPGVTTYDDTDVFGVGALLLAGTEILKLK